MARSRRGSHRRRSISLGTVTRTSDSHLGLPRIAKTRAQLDAAELIPFRSLVAAGVPSVMTGHMALPLVTGGNTPASLSREITTGILREEMGFKGVVVTDCLEMDAGCAERGRAPWCGACAGGGRGCGDDMPYVRAPGRRDQGGVRRGGGRPHWAREIEGRRRARRRDEGAIRERAMTPRHPTSGLHGLRTCTRRSLRLSREAYPEARRLYGTQALSRLAVAGLWLLLTPRVEGSKPGGGPRRRDARR